MKPGTSICTSGGSSAINCDGIQDDSIEFGAMQVLVQEGPDAVRAQRFAREGAVGGGRVLYYLVKPSPGHYLARQR